jgi:hypothetical protein
MTALRDSRRYARPAGHRPLHPNRSMRAWTLLPSFVLIGVLGLVTVGTSVAMHSDLPRAAQPIAQISVEPTPKPPVSDFYTAPTSIVLLVRSADEAQRYRAGGSNGGLSGTRGEFTVTVAVVPDVGEELALRAMLLGNESMCPAWACAQVAIVDLRAGD